MRPVSAGPFNNADVDGMTMVFVSRPVGSKNLLPPVSHPTLTDRE